MTPLDLITSIPPKINRIDPYGNDIGIEYLRGCIHSWMLNGFTVRTLNRQNEVEQIKSSFRLDPVLFADSDESFYKGRFGPTFGDLLSHVDLSKPVGIINADIHMLRCEDLCSRLEEACHKAFLFAHRVDCEGSLGFQTVYRHGVDFVAFQPDKILPVLEDEGFKSFKMGLVWWDYVLPIAASFFAPVFRISEPFILHRMHDRAWDSEIYKEMELRAFDVLLRLANRTRFSCEAAALFADRATPLDLKTTEGRHGFFQLCTGWCAGEIGPVKEMSVPLDGVDGALTGMIRSGLSYSAGLTGEFEALRRELEKRQRELEKRRKDVLRLKLRVKEEKRANAKLRKALSKSGAGLRGFEVHE